MVGISLRNVTKRFGTTAAVKDVSLEIKRGELFFLLGPSGCGKTTVLRMIAGFERPDSGSVSFDGRAMDDVPPHKRNTGLVFQSYALWPHMTVEKNVAYGLEERGVRGPDKAARVHKALQAVRMEQYAERSPNQLSGGQQQRVALARALVIEPDVVLMDEPLSNLDARLRLEMRHEIRSIHDATGVTMLYVTHDQKESLSMADRIAVMGMGTLEQIGDPRTIYRSPANIFVAGFIGEANFIAGKLVERGSGTGTVETALGKVKARLGASAPASAGAPVVCMVRPECLRVGTLPAGTNMFKAKVAGSAYLGELEEYRLEAGGLNLKAVVPNPGETPTRTGTEIAAGFASEDALVLAP